jgi:peptidyl-prolyl cis-trans isomerase SurA
MAVRVVAVLAAASLSVGLILQASGCFLLPARLAGKASSKASATPTATPTPTPTPVAAAGSPVAQTPAGALVVQSPSGGLAGQSSSGYSAASTQPALNVPHITVAHIVASVDGEPITTRDVEQFAAAVGHPVKGDDIADNPDAKAALKALISQKLLEKEVQQYSSKVDEDQVDRYIDSIEREKHLTPDQFKAALAQSGLSMEDFRKHAREELEKEMMIREQIRQRVNISNAEIQTYYDEHKADFTIKTERLKLAQILIGVPENATPQQVAILKAKADRIRKEAAAGADFALLARKYSDDVSRNNGGELGYFAPGDIMDAIYAAVKNLKPGEVSQVVRSSHGFHILKLEEHEVPGVRPLVEVKNEIRNRLIDQQANAQLQNWVETDLVKKHDVETFY